MPDDDTAAMSLAEAIDNARPALVTTRPCRAPYHTLSDVGLIDGGQVPRLGDVSLAHHDMLVLDAWPTCRRHVL
jgi:magnesium chelatase family protein